MRKIAIFSLLGTLLATVNGVAATPRIVSHEEIIFDSPDAQAIRVVIAPGDTWTPNSQRGVRLVVAITSNHTRRHTKADKDKFGVTPTTGEEIRRDPGDTVCRITPSPTIHNLNPARAQISVIILLKHAVACPSSPDTQH